MRPKRSKRFATELFQHRHFNTKSWRKLWRGFSRCCHKRSYRPRFFAHLAARWPSRVGSSGCLVLRRMLHKSFQNATHFRSEPVRKSPAKLIACLKTTEMEEFEAQFGLWNRFCKTPSSTLKDWQVIAMFYSNPVPRMSSKQVFICGTQTKRSAMMRGMFYMNIGI